MSVLPEPSAQPRQLIYTNVDHMVDGEQRSGWHVMAVDGDWDPADVDEVVSRIDARLPALAPLSAFPSEEEVRAADRRLVQWWTGRDCVLIHSAQAGPDTTGRPNTVSHVLALPDSYAPRMRATQLWRSPFWLAPYGADAVRSSVLPPLPAGSLPVGQSTDADALLTFLSRAPRAQALGQIADLLSQRLEARMRGEDTDVHSTLVIPIDSCDEGALVLALLEALSAPLTMRRLTYSSFQRIGSRSQLEQLAESDYDLLCVPRQDLIDMTMPAGVVLITGESQDLGTPYGRLVRAAASSMRSFLGAMTGLENVFDFLQDTQGLHPAWPLAMVEAMKPGSVARQYEGDLDSDLSAIFIACQPAALHNSSYLLKLAHQRILADRNAHPRAWLDNIAHLPAGAPTGGVNDGVARKFLACLALDPQWVRDISRPHSRAAADFLGRWSQTPASATVIAQSLEPLMSADASEQALLSNLQTLAAVCADGIIVPEEPVMRWLKELPRLLGPQASAILIDAAVRIPLPAQLAATVRLFVSDTLQEYDNTRVGLPVIDRRIALWLQAADRGDGAQAPVLRDQLLWECVAAEEGQTFWHGRTSETSPWDARSSAAGGQGSGHAPVAGSAGGPDMGAAAPVTVDLPAAVERVVAALAREPRPYVLTRPIHDLLARHMSPTQLRALPETHCRSWVTLANGVLLRYATTPEALSLARHLAGKPQAYQDLVQLIVTAKSPMLTVPGYARGTKIPHADALAVTTLVQCDAVERYASTAQVSELLTAVRQRSLVTLYLSYLAGEYVPLTGLDRKQLRAQLPQLAEALKQPALLASEEGTMPAVFPAAVVMLFVDQHESKRRMEIAQTDREWRDQRDKQRRPNEDVFGSHSKLPAAVLSGIYRQLTPGAHREIDVALSPHMERYSPTMPKWFTQTIKAERTGLFSHR